MNYSQQFLDEIIDRIVGLVDGYSHVKRKTTQPYILAEFQSAFPGTPYNPESTLVRESLLEHVGSLPILATALYPYIDDARVNLGDALTMLAIHDIGETITGDEMSFTKNREISSAEFDAAKSLVHPNLHAVLAEAEGIATPSSRFAKSIDKIAPDFLDYIMPVELSDIRYKHFMGMSVTGLPDLLIKHKRPFMTWNPFLHAFHVRLVDRMTEKIARTALI